MAREVDRVKSGMQPSPEVYKVSAHWPRLWALKLVTQSSPRDLHVDFPAGTVAMDHFLSCSTTAQPHW